MQTLRAVLSARTTTQPLPMSGCRFSNAGLPGQWSASASFVLQMGEIICIRHVEAQTSLCRQQDCILLCHTSNNVTPAAPGTFAVQGAPTLRLHKEAWWDVAEGVLSGIWVDITSLLCRGGHLTCLLQGLCLLSSLDIQHCSLVECAQQQC